MVYLLICCTYFCRSLGLGHAFFLDFLQHRAWGSRYGSALTRVSFPCLANFTNTSMQPTTKYSTTDRGKHFSIQVSYHCNNPFLPPVSNGIALVTLPHFFTVRDTFFSTSDLKVRIFAFMSRGTCNLSQWLFFESSSFGRFLAKRFSFCLSHSEFVVWLVITEEWCGVSVVFIRTLKNTTPSLVLTTFNIDLKIVSMRDHLCYEPTFGSENSVPLILNIRQPHLLWFKKWVIFICFMSQYLRRKGLTRKMIQEHLETSVMDRKWSRSI